METATKQDLIDLKTRLKHESDTRAADLENRLVEQMRNVETSLLTEFRKWALPVSARLRSTETTDAGLVERVGLLEERMNQLDRGRQAH